MKPRFRIFAGPNGSGKSTLFEYLRSKKNIHTEIYVSADRIEAELRKKNTFVFNAYRVSTTKDDFFNYITSHGMWNAVSAKDPGEWFTLKSGVVKVKKSAISSYSASFIAGYLVDKLMKSGQSFCFETVMSHKSKLDLFGKAKACGYKTYLYYIFTQSIELNIARIKLRVEAGGHDVSDVKVRERFGRSMRLLLSAVGESDVSYIIDNTYNNFNIVGEGKDGKVFWADRTLPEFFRKFKK